MQETPQSMTRIEITQDKLVDILLHAATREDLAKLAADTKSEFVHMDAKIDKLAADTKSEFVRMDAKIDKLAADTKSEFVRMDAKIDNLSSKIVYLYGLIIASILMPLALHFWGK